jgi:hypothetical protein
MKILSLVLSVFVFFIMAFNCFAASKPVFIEKNAAIKALGKLSVLESEKGASGIIVNFAGQVKFQNPNFNGNKEVLYKDIQKAVKILDKYTPDFSDKTCGNYDGTCSTDEFALFQKTTMQRPGFRVLNNILINSAVAKNN